MEYFLVLLKLSRLSENDLKLMAQTILASSLRVEQRKVCLNGMLELTKPRRMETFAGSMRY